MKLSALFLSFIFCAAAQAASPTYPLLPLQDNGRAFITANAKLPLRCLDVPGLLALPAEEQAEALNKAAAAGFNAVSFEFSLLGVNGFAKTLGKLDAAQGDNLTRLLQACVRRRLYAFPVLWSPPAVDAMVGTLNAKTVFFGGKNSLGWQHWLLREMAKLKVEGQPLTKSAAVGGWILYRGPWPDGTPLPNAMPPRSTPTAEAWLRQWAQWQVRAFRKLGFQQRMGLGLWARQDLPLTLERSADVEPPRVEGAGTATPTPEAAPYAPLSGSEVKVDTSLEHAKELDALPPVPGVADLREDEDEEGPAPSSQATTPWDLEGLDWDKVEGFFSTAPLSTQVDFLEFSLETEDWYRVGERLAEAAGKAEVPVLWRQDWRTASRYERPKRLEPPVPLAGLVGPWPEEDWPADGEVLWPSAKSDAQVPFAIKKLELKKLGRRIVLDVELNKPANIILRWGKAWPMNQESRNEGREKAEHRLNLPGAEPGQWLLVQLKADTRKAGGAVARARWLRVPR